MNKVVEKIVCNKCGLIQNLKLQENKKDYSDVIKMIELRKKEYHDWKLKVANYGWFRKIFYQIGLFFIPLTFSSYLYHINQDDYYAWKVYTNTPHSKYFHKCKCGNMAWFDEK